MQVTQKAPLFLSLSGLFCALLLNLSVLAKPMEALGLLMGFPAGLPTQLAGSVAVTATLYLAGIKFATARRTGESALIPILVSLCMAVACALLAYEQIVVVAGDLPDRLAFALLGLAGPPVAFLAGAESVAALQSRSQGGST